MRNFLYRDNREGVNMKKIIFIGVLGRCHYHHAFPEEVAGLMLNLAVCNSVFTKRQIQIETAAMPRMIEKLKETAPACSTFIQDITVKNSKP